MFTFVKLATIFQKKIAFLLKRLKYKLFLKLIKFTEYNGLLVLSSLWSSILYFYILAYKL